MFTQRSKFFRTARKPEWLAGNPSKPVDLTHENPATFQTYVECVYRGPEVIREDPGAFDRDVRESIIVYPDLHFYNLPSHYNDYALRNLFKDFREICICEMDDTSIRASATRSSRSATIGFTTAQAGGAAQRARDGYSVYGHQLTIRFIRPSERPSTEEQRRRYELADKIYGTLIKLYLLADMLQDVTTVNMVLDAVDEVFRLSKVHPGPGPMAIAYDSFAEADPLRLLLRDLWVYETDDYHCPQRLKDEEFPYALLRDLAVLYVTDAPTVVSSQRDLAPYTDATRMCNYHQHDKEHPICSSDPEQCICSLDLEESDYAMSTE